MAGPLRVEPDVEVGRWLQGELADVWTVAAVVPPIFDAYARILHPATLSTPTGETDVLGQPVHATREITWARAAELIGDRDGQRQPWTAWLNRFGDDQIPLADGGWVGPPRVGDIPLPLLTDLAELLLEEHGDADVLAGVWEGSGLDVGSGSSVLFLADDDRSAAEQERDRHELQAALEAARRASVDPQVVAAIRRGDVLGLPREQQGRGHVLLRGRLAAFAEPSWVERAGLGRRGGEWVDEGRTPNLLWPAEPHARPAWMIGTDIDLDVTLVGGSARVIGRVLGHPAIEAERIRPTDPLL